MYVRNYMCMHMISILHNALYIIIHMLHYYYRINIIYMLSQVHYNIYLKSIHCIRHCTNYARFTMLHVHSRNMHIWCSNGTIYV